ncbi:MAG: SCO family protein [Balneolaceae bacterium]
MKKPFYGRFLAAICVALILAAGCSRLSVKDNISGESYNLINQNGEQVTFPDDFKGKYIILGYVYTKCPDICPMITYNMRDVQRELSDEKDVHFISISFDPSRDTPEILAQYAKNYRINVDNWTLLTGDRSTIDKLLNRLEIAVVKTPTRFTDSGEAIYFLDHTDRVSFVDNEGNIRRNYYGSELNSEEVVSDIKTLLYQKN